MASLNLEKKIHGNAVYSWISERLLSFGKVSCFVDGNEDFSYLTLQGRISQATSELNQLGIQSGQIIGLIAPENFYCLTLFMALLLNRNIVVPVSDDVADHEDKWAISGVQWYYDGLQRKWFRRAANVCPELVKSLQREKDGGVVFFTSGTTGKPKAVLLQAGHILKKFQNVKKSWRSLIFLKLDHIGGINTLLSIWLNGGCIVRSKDRSVKEVCHTIQEKQVDLLPTTPSFLNMLLLSSVYRQYNLSSLKIITYGTEPMPDSTLKALYSTFPGIKLKQTYGLTELGIFSTQSESSDSKWMKIKGEGVSLQVRDGELWIRSECGMKGYLNAPSPFDAQGWYNTGDRVEKKGDYYRVLGRKSDIINVGGEKVYPVEVESVLLEMPYVVDVKVEGKYNPVVGQVVCATFVLDGKESMVDFKKRMRAFCAKRLARYKIPIIVKLSNDPLVGHRFKKERAI